MTRYLLDVNALIALMDPAHVLHEHAHVWFASTGSQAWASCPTTQNGVIRIVGSPRYPNSPGTPAAVAKLLRSFLGHPGHEFWPDSESLLHGALVQPDRLLDSAQITDSYLLALAVKNGGRLATFDRKIVTDAVMGGSAALYCIR